MGRLVINNAMTVNGAFEAPGPEPDGWLVLDADSAQVSLEQFLVADAMVLGRKTYEGLAAVWPQLADDPTLRLFADRMNSMPKYVVSRTLSEPLEWNATLLEGDLAKSMTALKERHDRTLAAVGAGELTHALTTLGLVDEFWFWVSPSLWPAGPRIFDGVGPVRLELIGSTMVRLAYRPAPTDRTEQAPRVCSRVIAGHAPSTRCEVGGNMSGLVIEVIPHSKQRHRYTSWSGLRRLPGRRGATTLTRPQPRCRMTRVATADQMAVRTCPKWHAACPCVPQRVTYVRRVGNYFRAPPVHHQHRIPATSTAGTAT